MPALTVDVTQSGDNLREETSNKVRPGLDLNPEDQTAKRNQVLRHLVTRIAMESGPPGR